MKPIDGKQGKGIKFFRDLNSLPDKIILMKYITNPLLLNKKKFDMRIYSLVTSMNPLKVYLYTEGFVKITAEEFDTKLENLDNVQIHITNQKLNIANFIELIFYKE